MVRVTSYYGVKLRITKKRKIVEDLGGCQICGYGLKAGDNLAALCFHHLKPETKTFRPSTILQGKDISEVLNDTILVCQNCHYEVYHPKKKVPTSRNGKLKLKNYIAILRSKGDRCNKCKKDLNVLSTFDLHHTGEKNFAPAQKIQSYQSNKEVKRELDKCVLLCRNCHFSEHHPLLEISKLDNYLYHIEEELREKTRKKNPLNNFSDSTLSKIFSQYGEMGKLFKELGITDGAGYTHLRRRGIKRGLLPQQEIEESQQPCLLHEGQKE